MKNLLSLIVIIPLLTSCIFGNKGGNNEEQKGAGPVLGGISLIEERSLTSEGAKAQSDFLALFGRPNAISKAMASVLERVETENTRETICDYKAETQSEATAHIVSVGKLLISVQGKTLEVPFDSKQGYYYGVLNKGAVWPEANYVVKAEGSGEALAFEVPFTMPAALDESRINNDLIENSTITLNNSSAVNISWKAQPQISDDDLMLFNISGEKSGTKVSFACAVKEKDTGNSWVIPAEQMAKIPSGVTNAGVALMRRHKKVLKDTGTILDMTVFTDRLRSTILNLN